MYVTKSALSICVSIIFLIALLLFLIVYIKDKNRTGPNDRPGVDKAWIIVFMVILITGFLVSLWITYKHANSMTTHYLSPTSFKSPYSRRNKFKNM